MPEEMRNIAVCCSHRNIMVGATSELGKAILKIIISNAYDLGFMLYNGDLGGFREFTSGISEAVLQSKLVIQVMSGEQTSYLRDSCVCIDKQDDRSDSARLSIRCPGSPQFPGHVERFLDGHIQCTVF